MDTPHSSDDYKELLSEVIAKQAIILGPDIAVLKARSVEGLSVTDDGTVKSIDGNPDDVLEHLIDAYVALSGQIVKNALVSVFKKYPHINKS